MVADERDEIFAVQDKHLVRSVTPAPGRGKPYVHRCSQSSFESIAHAVDESDDNEGFTLEELAERARLPHTQVAVALAFLKERGCVVTRYRRCFANGPAVFEDAMCEFHALLEEQSRTKSS